MTNQKEKSWPDGASEEELDNIRACASCGLMLKNKKGLYCDAICFESDNTGWPHNGFAARFGEVSKESPSEGCDES